MTSTWICAEISLLLFLPYYPAIIIRFMFVSESDVGEIRFMLYNILWTAICIFIVLKLVVFVVQLIF